MNLAGPSAKPKYSLVTDSDVGAVHKRAELAVLQGLGNHDVVVAGDAKQEDPTHDFVAKNNKIEIKELKLADKINKNNYQPYILI